VVPGTFRAMPRAVLPVGLVVDALVFGLPVPVVASGLAALRRCRRRRRGLCAGCGYNRKGLAEGAVCPECGSKGSPA
jgi:hypothetical protein